MIVAPAGVAVVEAAGGGGGSTAGVFTVSVGGAGVAADERGDAATSSGARTGGGTGTGRGRSRAVNGAFRESSAALDWRGAGAVGWLAARGAAAGGATTSAGRTDSAGGSGGGVSVGAAAGTGSATSDSVACSGSATTGDASAASGAAGALSRTCAADVGAPDGPSRVMRIQGNAMAIAITATSAAISGRRNAGADGAAVGVALTLT